MGAPVVSLALVLVVGVGAVALVFVVTVFGVVKCAVLGAGVVALVFCVGGLIVVAAVFVVETVVVCGAAVGLTAPERTLYKLVNTLPTRDDDVPVQVHRSGHLSEGLVAMHRLTLHSIHL